MEPTKEMIEASIAAEEKWLGQPGRDPQTAITDEDVYEMNRLALIAAQEHDPVYRLVRKALRYDTSPAGVEAVCEVLNELEDLLAAARTPTEERT